MASMARRLRSWTGTVHLLSMVRAFCDNKNSPKITVFGRHWKWPRTSPIIFVKLKIRRFRAITGAITGLLHGEHGRALHHGVLHGVLHTLTVAIHMDLDRLPSFQPTDMTGKLLTQYSFLSAFNHHSLQSALNRRVSFLAHLQKLRCRQPWFSARCPADRPR